MIRCQKTRQIRIDPGINNCPKFCTKNAEYQKYLYFHLVYRFTMFSRLLALIFALVLNISCDISSGRRTALLKEMATDTIVDFSAVDVYPLFLDCNNCDTSEKQNLCFEMELGRRLQRAFNDSNLDAGQMETDTLMVDILVDDQGHISIVEIHRSEKLVEPAQELESLLFESVAALPDVIQPALKRGIPVNSMYKLPIVVSSRR